MSESAKLVTLNGECFDVTFDEARTTLPTRACTLHYFRLNDLVIKRGERLVSLYFFNFDRLSIPDFDIRLRDVRLNTIRRAFDSGALSFDSDYDPHTYKEFPLTVSDFGQHQAANDLEIRQFIVHKAYWLSYKHGNYPVQFDDEADLDYLGVGYADVRRGIWYLNAEGMLEKVNIEGHGRASLKLVKAYESKQVTKLPNESVFPAGTQYEAFKQISRFLSSATTEILIIDNYLNY